MSGDRRQQVARAMYERSMNVLSPSLPGWPRLPSDWQGFWLSAADAAIAELRDHDEALDSYPTQEEAARAARVLIRCNGADLSDWVGHEWWDLDWLKLLAALTPTEGAPK